ncbi:hypothetical protein G5714_009610 [Onychostoma macrolepis]|uniref:Uncharacterized protein n=1 Tax=Onychostoma macrolepis TaxID=369639 RepID=A0A7J6CSQ0_9TELE|nr:hypothetical protein G5714_009610 [Onychostoma macrolepis]
MSSVDAHWIAGESCSLHVRSVLKACSIWLQQKTPSPPSLFLLSSTSPGLSKHAGLIPTIRGCSVKTCGRGPKANRAASNFSLCEAPFSRLSPVSVCWAEKRSDRTYGSRERRSLSEYSCPGPSAPPKPP